ncbi:hypothetical protein [Kiloniella antarctica]|uniref:Transposase n=1 Tax=Kiloniella antarctica TaxID=1550907 RepID=A0ABW5BM02_9PROT
MRGGKDYDARWGKRMRGEGVFAKLIADRFALSRQRYGLNRRSLRQLDTESFAVPKQYQKTHKSAEQMDLFM